MSKSFYNNLFHLLCSFEKLPKPLARLRAYCLSKICTSNIRIVGDGTSSGTRVIGSDNKPIELVQSLTFTIDAATNTSTVVMTILNVPVDISVDENLVSYKEGAL